MGSEELVIDLEGAGVTDNKGIEEGCGGRTLKLSFLPQADNIKETNRRIIIFIVYFSKTKTRF